MNALAKTDFPIEHVVNQKLKSVLKSLRTKQPENVYKDLSEEEVKMLIPLMQ